VSGVLPHYKKALRYPDSESFQPSRAALAILAKRLNLAHPPVIPRLHSTGAPLSFLPLPIAWELASHWDELGELESATRLREWVAQFGFLAASLYYPERGFDAAEMEEFTLAPRERSAIDSHLGMAASQFGEIESCFTLTGANTGLGSMRLGSVRVPSFGPELPPLSHMSRFGLLHGAAVNTVSFSSEERVALEGWTRLYGDQEICLNLRTSTTKEAVLIDVRFLGIEPGRSAFMAFYVSAKTCTLEGEGTYHPGGLQGYRGKRKVILLDDSVQLSSSQGTDMQVIPLAGNSCFWNAAFLIAFEFNSCNYSDSISFKFI
jgi:hypothetical protein